MNQHFLVITIHVTEIVSYFFVREYHIYNLRL